MRKRMFLVLSLIVAGFYVAPVVMADDAMAPKKEGATEKPAMSKRGKMSTIKGEVTEVDSAANIVKIKDADKEVTLNVTEKTAITSGKTKKSLADVKAGDKVVAKITQEEGKMTARSIRVGVGGGKMFKKDAPKMEAPTTK